MRDCIELRETQIAARRAQPAIHHALMRAEGDVERLAMAVEDRLQPDFERRFADAGRAELHVGFAIEQQAALRQPRQHLVDEHRLEFVGRAGQHAKDLAAILEPESRGRAVGVGNDFAAHEFVGLLEIVLGHLATERREPLRNGLLDRGVENELPAEHPGHDVAGAIVTGRTESAGRDDHIGARPALAELALDRRRLVGDRDVAVEDDAAAAELRADEREVAVGGEAEQQLVAEREQFVANRGYGCA